MVRCFLLPLFELLTWTVISHSTLQALQWKSGRVSGVVLIIVPILIHMNYKSFCRPEMPLYCMSGIVGGNNTYAHVFSNCLIWPYREVWWIYTACIEFSKMWIQRVNRTMIAEYASCRTRYQAHHGEPKAVVYSFAGPCSASYCTSPFLDMCSL